MNPRKTVGAVVFKLNEEKIIDSLLNDGFEIIKLNDNDSYVYKDNTKLSPVELIKELRGHGVYVIRSSIVKTLVYSGDSILSQSEYSM